MNYFRYSKRYLFKKKKKANIRISILLRINYLFWISILLRTFFETIKFYKKSQVKNNWSKILMKFQLNLVSKWKSCICYLFVYTYLPIRYLCINFYTHKEEYLFYIPTLSKKITYLLTFTFSRTCFSSIPQRNKKSSVAQRDHLHRYCESSVCQVLL